MKIYKSYKTELKPNNKQKTLFRKGCGVTRFVYNWGLDRVQKRISKPNAFVLSKELNAVKKKEFPWIYEVSKCASEEALFDLEEAFKRFFKVDKSGKKANFPKFKKKHSSKQSFRLKGSIEVKENKIKLPRIGFIRLKQKNYLPQNIKIISATVIRYVNKWFVSILVEEEMQPRTLSGVLGVDLGIKNLATCSDGTIFENPKALKNKLKKLQRITRKISNQKNGGKNREKTRKKLAKLHYKIVCIRKDTLHKITTWVTRTKLPEVVVLEDLNVNGMLKNHKLALAISDVSWHEFKRQIEYKQKWNGGQVVLVNRFFPSSKTCSSCGYVREELKLNERKYMCSNCGMKIDRDLNAAINLEKYGRGLVK